MVGAGSGSSYSGGVGPMARFSRYIWAVIGFALGGGIGNGSKWRTSKLHGISYEKTILQDKRQLECAKCEGRGRA